MQRKRNKQTGRKTHFPQILANSQNLFNSNKEQKTNPSKNCNSHFINNLLPIGLLMT